MRSSPDFEVKEIYTRISKDEILFQYEEPWSAEIPIQRMDAEQKLYEYACHEGNYSVPIMLRTARMEESGLL